MFLGTRKETSSFFKRIFQALVSYALHIGSFSFSEKCLCVNFVCSIFNQLRIGHIQLIMIIVRTLNDGLPNLK